MFLRRLGTHAEKLAHTGTVSEQATVVYAADDIETRQQRVHCFDVARLQPAKSDGHARGSQTTDTTGRGRLRTTLLLGCACDTRGRISRAAARPTTPAGARPCTQGTAPRRRPLPGGQRSSQTVRGWIIYSQFDQAGSNLMLVENIR
jgi:hypothetical protein